MVPGNHSAGRSLSVVCQSCSHVARMPLSAFQASQWKCPSCGVAKAMTSGLPDAAVLALAPPPPPAPVFSESYRRPQPR
jgi:predicted RNA-binding Zn-ribbon protein involved in translation (DUF1610 family)